MSSTWITGICLLERVELREADYLTRAQLTELVRTSNYHPDPSLGDEPARVLFPMPGTNHTELAFVVATRETSGNQRPVQILLRAIDGQVLGKTFSRAEFR